MCPFLEPYLDPSPYCIYIPLQERFLDVHILDVTDVNRCEPQVCGEHLLPLQHAVRYLAEVPLHPHVVPVQQLLEVRDSREREGGDMTVEIIAYIPDMKKK